MTTARDIIAAALEDTGVIGVGQTPLAEDMNFGLARLNRMIGQMNRRRWLVYHLIDVACITTGNPVYTVGIGGNFSVTRPDRLEDGNFFRQAIGGPLGSGGDFNSDFNNDFGPGQQAGQGYFVDYPLTLIEAREDFNRIALKNLASWPSFVFYDAAMTLQTPVNGSPQNVQFPCGNLHINPVPAAGQFEIHLCIKETLANLANLSTVLSTPPEYEEAFEYNLALRFCAKYQIDATKEIIGLAAASLATIRSANSQVPLQQLPTALTGKGRHYNVYSDRSN